MMAIAANHQPSALRADSRVNHHKVDRSRRKIRICLCDRKCAIEDIKGLDRMADVHDLHVGNDVNDHAFNRPDEVIVKTEVGSQSDDRPL